MNLDDAKNWRVINLKYQCRCNYCDGLLLPRMTASWNKETHRVRCHPECIGDYDDDMWSPSDFGLDY